MILYIDSFFSIKEVFDYLVPIIVEKRYIVCNSYFDWNLSECIYIGSEEFNDINFNIYKCKEKDSNIDIFIEFNDENFELFKIRNFVSKELFKKKVNCEREVLKIENSFEKNEIIINLNMDFLIEHPNVFSVKNAEKYLDLIIFSRLLRIVEKLGYIINSDNTLIYKVKFKSDYALFQSFWNEVEKLNMNISIDIQKKCFFNSLKNVNNVLELIPLSILKSFLMQDVNIDIIIKELEFFKRVILGGDK
ncbi:hypothetical protein XJ44_00315 [Thermosipho affectus]|uniref:Uncharacterized protein n=1 Tax=Thermosipho affectus TaxID=660294 RepID=A0ABX3ILE6_9BACT|nr:MULTISPECIES: hypothetical protein [Thermosipho]ANQ54543.1 hypothetical protein Y592_00325 [Thermosipho sp. 1070]APT72982.1 hypothetical protein BG95_00320 [Thermosipho sp. 1063]ONN28027.1 hypothetical protein XJ44_00315 [Thermosipho affectus]OOC45517.1 hypothetical protein XO08_00330 [Thermosipho sp. 1074]